MQHEHHSLEWWLPRGECGPWEPWLFWTYMFCNIAIFVCYMAIPLELFVIARARGLRVPFSATQVVGWSGFIFFCGLNHFAENVGAFVWPNYYVFTAIHGLTAAFSAYTVVTFPLAASKLVAGGSRG